MDEKQLFNPDELGFPPLEEGSAAPEVNETPEAENTEIKETPAEDTKPDEKLAEPEPINEGEKVTISNPPVQYDGESDIQFNLRTQLYNAGQAKAQAKTEEEKSIIAQHMKELRKEMAINSSTSSKQAPQTQDQAEPTQSPSEEEAAKLALKKLGVPDKDDVLKIVSEIVQSQKSEIEHASAINEFYSQRKDIASSPEKKAMLEDVVIKRFNVTPQTTKQELLVAMDMAASYLFPKINRQTAVNTAAEKRDLLNISSNTQSVKTVSKEDEMTSSKLKELGISMKDMGWE